MINFIAKMKTNLIMCSKKEPRSYTIYIKSIKKIVPAENRKKDFLFQIVKGIQ
jgi:hypothetical protein